MSENPRPIFAHANRYDDVIARRFAGKSAILAGNVRPSRWPSIPETFGMAVPMEKEEAFERFRRTVV
jgi:hypothetical protein